MTWTPKREREVLERCEKVRSYISTADYPHSYSIGAELGTLAFTDLPDSVKELQRLRKENVALRLNQIQVCPGCSEANGTDGWAVVRNLPPLCKTNAERAAIDAAKEPK